MIFIITFTLHIFFFLKMLMKVPQVKLNFCILIQNSQSVFHVLNQRNKIILKKTLNLLFFIEQSPINIHMQVNTKQVGNTTYNIRFRELS